MRAGWDWGRRLPLVYQRDVGVIYEQFYSVMLFCQYTFMAKIVIMGYSLFLISSSLTFLSRQDPPADAPRGSGTGWRPEAGCRRHAGAHGERPHPSHPAISSRRRHHPGCKLPRVQQADPTQPSCTTSWRVGLGTDFMTSQKIIWGRYS